MRPYVRAAACVFLLALAGTALLGPPAPAGETRHRAVVSADPVDFTPHVLDGQVKAIAMVSGKVIVGGSFTQVRPADSDRTLERHNIFAFDRATGKIDSDFAPHVDGPVRALARAPHGTVVLGGSFRMVDGHAAGGLARLRVGDGSRVASFAGSGIEGGHRYVSDLAVHGSHLYAAGWFTAVDGAPRAGLARLDLADGHVDQRFAIRPSQPRAGGLKVLHLALSPDGSRLAIDGTFTKVDGKRRYQLALVNTAASRPRLARWATEAYTDRCKPKHFPTYLRDIDFSPDGSYFVVVTTGGMAGPRLMCDSAARFETHARGPNVRPTWVNRTGGDSLYAVTATGAAVYVGGHQRWMDNPYGVNAAGPGAKSRPGIAALNPRTGRATSWNPTRTLGHGVEALLATKHGLYVGSDTDQLGYEYHGRIGMFPTRR